MRPLEFLHSRRGRLWLTTASGLAVALGLVIFVSGRSQDDKEPVRSSGTGVAVATATPIPAAVVPASSASATTSPGPNQASPWSDPESRAQALMNAGRPTVDPNTVPQQGQVNAPAPLWVGVTRGGTCPLLSAEQLSAQQGVPYDLAHGEGKGDGSAFCLFEGPADSAGTAPRVSVLIVSSDSERSHPYDYYVSSLVASYEGVQSAGGTSRSRPDWTNNAQTVSTTNHSLAVVPIKGWIVYAEVQTTAPDAALDKVVRSVFPLI
jgi:hypothetical protein